MKEIKVENPKEIKVEEKKEINNDNTNENINTESIKEAKKGYS